MLKAHLILDLVCQNLAPFLDTLLAGDILEESCRTKIFRSDMWKSRYAMPSIVSLDPVQPATMTNLPWVSRNDVEYECRQSLKVD